MNLDTLVQATVADYSALHTNPREPPHYPLDETQFCDFVQAVSTGAQHLITTNPTIANDLVSLIAQLVPIGLAAIPGAGPIVAALAPVIIQSILGAMKLGTSGGSSGASAPNPATDFPPPVT